MSLWHLNILLHLLHLNVHKYSVDEQLFAGSLKKAIKNKDMDTKKWTADKVTPWLLGYVLRWMRKTPQLQRGKDGIFRIYNQIQRNKLYKFIRGKLVLVDTYYGYILNILFEWLKANMKPVLKFKISKSFLILFTFLFKNLFLKLT